MVEPQFTPEVAKGLAGVLRSPETQITGTSIQDRILEAVRGRLLAGQSENALKVLSGELVPYTDKDVERVLLWNLSSARKPDTQEKTNPTNSEERTRLRESREMVKVVRAFIEEGTIDPKLRGVIINFLERNSPVFRDIIQQMNRQDVDALVDDLMHLPTFRENLRTLFIERLDPKRRLTQEETVRSLEAEIEKLEAQLKEEVTQDKIDNARRELAAAELALAQRPEFAQIEAKTARLQYLRDNIDTIKQIYETYKAVGSNLEAEERRLLRQRRTLEQSRAPQSQIDNIDQQIEQIRRKPEYISFVTTREELKEYENLPGEIARLQRAILPYQQQVKEKQEALNALLERQKTNLTPQKRAEIEAQIKEKQRELADAKALLEAEMIQFYRDVTHMAEDAMEKTLNDAFTDLKTMWNEEAAQQLERDKTEQGKRAALAIEKAQNTLWRTKKTKGGLTFYVPDRHKARTILNKAFEAGGAENIAVYLETATPAELGITQEEHAALKEKLQDPEFRKTQCENIAKQALADYFIAGGRLSGDLVKSLMTTEFGRALLTEARAKADEALRQYKDTFGKGILDKSTRFSEFVKGNWWKFGIGILLLLVILGVIFGLKS